jgi:hypothetical protein
MWSRYAKGWRWGTSLARFTRISRSSPPRQWRADRQ